MDNSTTNYKEMYEGRAVIPPGTPGNPTDFPEVVYDTVYWYEDMSVSVEMTNKLSLDRPTLVWQIPAEKLGIHTYSAALADHCYRELIPFIEKQNDELYNRHKPAEETGMYYMVHPGGEILVRNTAYFKYCPQKDYVNRGGNVIVHYPEDELGAQVMCLCVRLQVQLPRKKIKKAIEMLCRDLPETMDAFVNQFDRAKAERAIAVADKQREIRDWLKKSSYCAFIANGSILPRDGKTGLPMENAVLFQAPKEDEIEVCGIRGLGIRRGVTVITGGGYSGKSTILDTISAGIYDHVAGDGRELCITDESAMTISAEDGRSVKNINITPFIRWIPGGDTACFSTEHASGSTSQAANIMEAVDCGSKLLLIDEDKSATNFMIRDRLMKELISREPITPFTERVNELYQSCGVSTVLVIGGSGEYLSIADNVYMMEEYRISNITCRAKELCTSHGIGAAAPQNAAWGQQRRMRTRGFTPYPEGSGCERLSVPDIGFIFIGDEKLDTRGLHDIVCDSQRTAMGFMLRWLEIHQKEAYLDLYEQIELLYAEIEDKGLDAVYSGFFPECGRFLACPRKYDLVGLINRMRMVQFE